MNLSILKKMPDDIRETLRNTSSGESPRSLRLLTEAVVEHLRLRDPARSELQKLLKELAESMDQCFALRQANGTFEEATQRAPWLTADAERLKRDWAALQQSLQAFQELARLNAASPDSLTRQFDEFTEHYLEYEASEQNFLQVAFPAPDWTEQI